MNITQQDIDKLGARLDTIDLSDREQAVLNLLVDQADDDVAGFAGFNPLRDVRINFNPLRGGLGVTFSVRKDDPASTTTISSSTSTLGGTDSPPLTYSPDDTEPAPQPKV